MNPININEIMTNVNKVLLSYRRTQEYKTIQIFHDEEVKEEINSGSEYGIIENSFPHIARKRKMDACSICLNNFVRDDITEILPCMHKFHKEFISTLLETKLICPLCRNPLN